MIDRRGKTNGRPPVVRWQIVEFAGRPQGVALRELETLGVCTYTTAKCIAHRLQGYGELFGNASKAFRRYFTTQAAADAYIEPPKPAKPKKARIRRKPKELHKKPGPKARTPRPPRPKKPKKTAALACPSVDAVSPHWKTRAPKKQVKVYEPTFTPQTIRTVGVCSPTYGRAQVQPGDPVPRVVNPAECRPWAAIAAQSIGGRA